LQQRPLQSRAENKLGFTKIQTSVRSAIELVVYKDLREKITLSFTASALVLAERSQFVLHLGRVRRFVTPPSQPCQDAKPRAIPGCPGPLAMEQLRP
jgi:hypothetical protein